MEYKLLTWNVNGLNSKVKRNKITHALKKQKLDLICLQETHVKKLQRKLLVNKSLGQEFISSDIKKKRGVVIYASDKLDPKQIFKDNEGRMIAVEVSLLGERVLVVGIYAPNDKKSGFFKELEEKLSERHGNIIIMGDYNGVVTPELDRSTTRQGSREGKLPISFFQLTHALDLQDGWRFMNPSVKDFTHYNFSHKTHSRIDMIWVSKELTTCIKKVEIQPKTFSDHNSMVFILQGQQKSTFRWRVNEGLLKNSEVLQKGRKTLKDYFEINMNQGTELNTVWDASKAVLRGFFIQQNAFQKKYKDIKKQELLKEITTNERKLVERPGDKTITQAIKLLQAQLSMLTLYEMEQKLKYLKQRHFEFANKPGRLLAWQLKKGRKLTIINKIKVEDKMIFNQKEIREEFFKFYENLYKSKETKVDDIKKYLNECDLPVLTREQVGILNAPISVFEVKQVINQAKSGKSPGPDGLTALVYKSFKELLIYPLKEVMNNVLQQGKIPDSWIKSIYISDTKRRSGFDFNKKLQTNFFTKL